MIISLSTRFGPNSIQRSPFASGGSFNPTNIRTSTPTADAEDEALRTAPEDWRAQTAEQKAPMGRKARWKTGSTRHPRLAEKPGRGYLESMSEQTVQLLDAFEAL